MARLGVGGVLTLSSVLVVAALFGYALAPSWATFFPLGVLSGLGSGAIDAGLNGYAARHFSVRHVNWLHACWGIGASMGPAVMTFVVARGYGYRTGYWFLGSLLGVMALLFSISRRRWDESSAVESGTRGEIAAGVGGGPPGLAPRSLSAALHSQRVWLQVLIFMLYAGVESTTGQWCFSWLRNQRGLGIEAAGAWTSAYWASLTLGRVVLGGFIDRVGPERMLRFATLGALCGVLLLASAKGLPGCLGLLVLGSSLAPIFPTLMARTPMRVGDDLAHHAVGLQVSASTLGSGLIPSAVGLLVARQGLGVVGAVLVSAALGLLLAHESLLRVAKQPTT